jgi:hypothetical protein
VTKSPGETRPDVAAANALQYFRVIVGRSCQTPAACALASEGESLKEMMRLRAGDTGITMGASLVDIIVPPSTSGRRRKSLHKYAFLRGGRSLIF